MTVTRSLENCIGAASPSGGGSAPVIDELNVTPSTSAQEITAPEGTDGFSPVKVSAVTASIDANIVAGNIKKDVQILGVTGTLESGGGGGGDTITATNYTNSAISAGDKVYINKVGNSYELVDFHIGENWWISDASGHIKPPFEDCTINSYIANNFSSYSGSDGLRFKKELLFNYLERKSNFEIGIKFLTPSSYKTKHMVMFGNKNSNYSTPQIELSASTGTFDFLCNTSGSSPWVSVQSANPLQTGTWYWCKCIWDGTQIEALLSTDGHTFTSLGTQNISSVYWNDDVFIGRDNDQSSHYTGSIDLSQMYIKINGDYVWMPIRRVLSQNVTENTFTGYATQNIAIGATGSVTTVLPNA